MYLKYKTFYLILKNFEFNDMLKIPLCVRGIFRMFFDLYSTFKNFSKSVKPFKIICVINNLNKYIQFFLFK